MWHGCQLSQLCLIIGNESRAWWWNFNHQVYYIANITIYWACLVPVFAYASWKDVCYTHHVRMIMHPQVTWQCIFPVADVISHKNMPTSSPQLVSQSIVSIASVVFLQFLMLSSCGVKWFQIEILWIESLLEMLLHCHSPARALVCKHVSLTNNLRQLCHLRHLDVCRSMFCLDVSRRGCIARQLHQWQGAGEFNYCESIQWTQVQAATVQFLNRGHVWVVAILAQNLQDLLHHSFWSIGGSDSWILSSCVNCVICLPWCRFLLLMAPFRLWSWPPVSFRRHVWFIGVRSELCVHYIK